MKRSLFIAALMMVFVPGSKTRNAESAIKVQSGFKAKTEQLKPVVQFSFPDNRFCSGIYLNETTILTAAHCFFDANLQRVNPTLEGQELYQVVLADFEEIVPESRLAQPPYKTHSEQIPPEADCRVHVSCRHG